MDISEGQMGGGANITGFVSKVTQFDDDSKNQLINAVQYVITAVIPIAIVYFVIKRFFHDDKPPTGSTLELLAEVTGHAMATVVLLLLVHRVIAAIPTYTGTPMEEVTYPNLILGIVLSMFALNPSISSKLHTIYDRLVASWEGKGTVSVNDNSVSVSQPISGSRQLLPRHQNSRADNSNVQQPPIVPNRQPPMQLPPPQQQQHQQQEQQQQQQPPQYQSDPPQKQLGQDTQYQEPSAANDGGGGGNWSAW